MAANRVVVSIVTRSHLPWARALALSLADTNPGVPLYVLLVDASVASLSTPEPFQIIDLTQLPDQPTIRRMSFIYSAFEFCNALKAHLSQYVSDQMSVDQWLYLDSDIMVNGSLVPIWNQLETGPILITPHCTRPIPDSAVDPYELMIIKHGIFNGGLMALKRSPQTSDFLRWFSNRLSRFAFYDDLAGMFVDQTWMSLIPCLYESTVICRHPGVNIGHWNLHERTLTQDDRGNILSNDQPVLCVHFSGWNFNKPEKVSGYAPAYLDPPPAAWAVLGKKYHSLLQTARYSPNANQAYGLALFTDGREITKRMRKGYSSDTTSGQGPIDPFNSADYFYKKYPPRFYRVRGMLPSGIDRLLKSIGGR